MKTSLLLSVPLSVLIYSNVFAHGDVTPQAMDTSTLPDVGEEWLEENPWRDPSSDVWMQAIRIGASGYNQNCARCHGLEVVSGGIAPDLRYLSADDYSDSWYIERFRIGATQNGITKMPGFEQILDQKAAWAIRTYIETRPADDAFAEHNERLFAIRDALTTMALSVSEGTDAGDLANEASGLKTELSEINATAKTASKAPLAESAASRAAAALDGSSSSFATAAEFLTIGLSAAQ